MPLSNRATQLAGILLLAAILLPCPAMAKQWPTLIREAQAMKEAGRYDEALELARQSITAADRLMGPGSDFAAISMTLIGNIHLIRDEFGQAEQELSKALQILESKLGADPLTIAIVMSNLASVHKAKGEYDKAEDLFRRSIELTKQHEGMNSEGMAVALNNLAGLQTAMGSHEEAERTYKEAGEIFRRVLGPEHVETARNMNNLAELYSKLKQYDRALPLSKQAYAIWERELGPEHPDTASSLNNLASLYFYTQDYAKAEPLMRKALALKEQTLGKDHQDVAIASNNLASLYRARREFAKALPLQRKAAAIWEQQLGATHPTLSISHQNMASLQLLTGDTTGALDSLRQAQAVDAALIQQVMAFTSDAQKLQFLRTVHKGLHGFLTLYAEQFRNDPRATSDAFTIWLQRKGVALEAQKAFQHAALTLDSPKTEALRKRLAAVRAQSSALAFAQVGADASNLRQGMDALRAQQQDIERQLASQSAPFARQLQRAKVDTSAVASALPPGSSLLEFVRLDVFDFQDVTSNTPWKPARYLAFVIRAGAPASLTCIPLGDAATVDAAVSDLITAMSARDTSTAQVRASNRLYKQVFSPLQQAIGKSTDIFLSPDGALTQLPFEILVDDQGKRLIETYSFNYLASGKELVGMGTTSQKRGGIPTMHKEAIILGDPDFDAGASKGEPSLPSAVFANARGIRKLNFTPLPGTRKEAVALKDIFGEDAVTLLGKEASEQNLISGMLLSMPRILHLATHGFVLSDAGMAAARSGPDPSNTTEVGDTLHVGLYENPLALSGLALAGANQATARGRLDGIFTAEKVLMLPLQDTSLVVLSACDTGRGKVVYGEGVLGLRRAFSQAGAKGIIMSLWPVPDQETAQLMTDLYQNLDQGMHAVAALRQAALTQRETLLRKTGADDPAAWGAFIFAGER